MVDIRYVATSRQASMYSIISLVMCGLVFFGAYASYFGPMLSGDAPSMPPLVHPHGAGLIAWALLRTVLVLIGVHHSLQPANDSFFRFNGIAVLSEILLFAGFYGMTIYYRRRRHACRYANIKPHELMILRGVSLWPQGLAEVNQERCYAFIVS